MIFAPMAINMLGFKVNVIDHSSLVSFGPVQQTDTFLSIKRNMGFGESNGDLGVIFVPLNAIVDTDATDSNAAKNSIV
ncbi:hypothetical protein ACFQI7_28750 [Paenibacillus allorhizosphaerae]|uniref:Spore germination protein n=1 Tax=Paenibacillus allorhizosphaerae TaxID=2849866 RepID=A0ABM8VMV1_9BACL|nr:hypothetical protein [Paenibacillus allorhizosphaerae]CAG7650087.1 hypothetical protein PAECIP111802_04635 [Paenibacillus allorhizosphaerae]